MLGKQDPWQEDLFVAGPLCDLIPDDHPLKRIDEVLDLSWLRHEVRDCYCLDTTAVRGWTPREIEIGDSHLFMLHRVDSRAGGG